MASLQDKVIILTGASSGIGAATARYLTQFKPKIVFASIDLDNLKNVADECVQLGLPKANSLVIYGDISKEEDVSKIVEKTVKVYNRIDVLINNAGIGGSTRSLEVFDRVFKTNLRGPFHLSQLCVPHLVKTKGAIVNVGSIVGHHFELPRLMIYGMCKAALEHFTRSLAVDLAPQKVRVNAVCPGYVLTDFGGRMNLSAEFKRKHIEEHSKEQELTGPIEPVEIAKAISFLASDDSSAVTGQLMCVDGGHNGCAK